MDNIILEIFIDELVSNAVGLTIYANKKTLDMSALDTVFRIKYPLLTNTADSAQKSVVNFYEQKLELLPIHYQTRKLIEPRKQSLKLAETAILYMHFLIEMIKPQGTWSSL